LTFASRGQIHDLERVDSLGVSGGLTVGFRGKTPESAGCIGITFQHATVFVKIIDDIQRTKERLCEIIGQLFCTRIGCM